jgi:hypothetical protein
VNGVATFSNLVLNTAGSYVLNAASGSLSAAKSTGITVNTGAAAKLAVIQAPTSATAGQALSSIKVAVEDAFGNVITSNTSSVSLVVNSGPNGFATGSVTSVAAVNGVATFSNLLCDTAGSYVIGASDGSLTKAASGSITVAAAAATKLAITQEPTSGNVNKALGSILIALEDQFGNLVRSNTSAVSVSVSSGPGTLTNGSTTTVAAVNGIATFSKVALSKKGVYTLKFSDGSLTSVVTQSIVVA